MKKKSANVIKGGDTVRFSMHKHDWTLLKTSNVLQMDGMGYPLRLCMFRCTRCGETSQQWVDVNEKEVAKLATGEAVMLEWI